MRLNMHPRGAALVKGFAIPSANWFIRVTVPPALSDPHSAVQSEFRHSSVTNKRKSQGNYAILEGIGLNC